MPVMVASLYAELSGDTTKLNKALRSAQTEMKGAARTIGNEAKKAGQQTGFLEGKMEAFKKSVMPAAAIVVGFGAAVKTAFDMAEAGANLERLATAGDELARSLGGNMDDILAKVRAASQGAVANSDIIAGANRAMMLGLGADSEKLANLMEVAAHRGRAMGVSTTQAFNDIVTGVGRMSPMILDNLGIIVDSEAVYGGYAESIGKAANELTGMEKRQALLNSVLDEGNAQIKAAGGVSADTATKFERLDASWTNFTDNVNKALSGPLGNVVEALDIILFSSQKLDQALAEQSDRVFQTANSYDEFVMSMLQAEAAAGSAQAQLALQNIELEGLTGIHREFADAVLDTSKAQFVAARRATELANAWVETGPFWQESSEEITRAERGMSDLADSSEKAESGIRRAGGAADESTGLFGGLADSVLDLGRAFMQGIPDASDMYSMLLETGRAAGMSVEELGQYAVALGAAESSEVALQLAGYRTIEQWEQGVMSGNALIAVTQAMERHASELALAEDTRAAATNAATENDIALADALNAEADAHAAAAEQALNQAVQLSETGSVLDTTTGQAEEYILSLGKIPAAVRTEVRSNLDEQIRKARELRAALAAIGTHSGMATNVAGGGGTVEGMAAGGPVTAGQPYLVGEAGPEPFIPSTSGTILPNSALSTTWTGNLIVHGTGDPNATAAAVVQKLQDRGIIPRTALR